MTKHVMNSALLASAALVRKGDDDDPADVVQKALDDLTKTVDERLKAVEKKPSEPDKAIVDRLDDLETKLARPAVHSGDADEPSPERKAFESYLRRGKEGMSVEEQKALTVGNSAQAGYLAPPEFGSEILKALREFSPIRQYARVVTIGAPEIRYPRRLTSTAATWVSETGNRTESGPTYEQVTLTPHEMATFVEVSRQLLEDNAYNLESELASDLAESFAITEGAAFVSGTGAGQPVGLLTSPDISEIEIAAITGDSLIDALYSLPSFHAQRAVWVLNRNTLATIRKLKDGDGNYLWQPGLRDGEPGTILGRPTVEAVDMPDAETGAAPIVIGDLSGYRIVDRVQFEMLVDPFTGARNGLTTIHARKRVGADVTHPDRLRKIVIE